MDRDCAELARTYAEIDLDALQENLAALKAGIPAGMKLCCVVKADAYGHGAEVLAREMNDSADLFAVAALSEAVALRRAAIAKPILVLSPVLPAAYEEAVRNFVTLTICDAASAAAFAQVAETLEVDAHVHVAVDTGMGRIGLTPDEAGLEELQRIAAVPNLSVDGVFTHFAKADWRDKTRTEQQLQQFGKFCRAAKACGLQIPLWHCANSAALIEGFGTEFDMMRAGICLYGHYPSEETERRVVLKPLLSLKSHLTFVKEVPAGSEISYGGIYCTERNLRVGTVCCGYADGYPRALSGKGAEVLVAGKRCRVLGRICMDQLMIDLSEVPEAKVGEVVTLIGQDGREQVSVEELAEGCGGFHYELLCNIGKRVPRIYRKQGELLSAAQMLPE